jgi:hypothetical protein
VRVIRKYENKKRGCNYCFNVEHVKCGHATQTRCPFDECPYKVLDKYDSYEDYMASEDSKILVDEFFQTVADYYMFGSVSKKPTKHYSDGDFKVNF